MKNKMKQKWMVIVIGLLGLLPLCTYAQKDATSGAAAAIATSATSANSVDTNTPHRGILFRVRHKGNTSYLFGTIHVGKPEFYPLGNEVMDALAKASKVAVEMDTANMQAVQAGVKKYGVYGINDSLKNHLSADTFVQLKLALEKTNISIDSVMQMKPWLVADLLMVSDLERGGYDRNQGVEDFLLKQARENNKQVIELEGVDYQLSLFSNLTEQQQTQFLVEVLTEIQDGKASKETDELANAWGHADTKALVRLSEEMLNEKTVSAEFTRRVLLDQRNPGMAKKIEKLLKHDKFTFVGVGLLHLIGEKSVPALLKKRGYRVEQVY